MRKSTALHQGKRLLRHSVEAAILADDFTPEKLTTILQNNAAGLLVVSEFTRLLDMVNRDYNAGLRQMLTELYDSPDKWIVERKKEGTSTIENAAISLLGATTLDWLGNRVESQDLRGGFLARFLFLPATKRGPRVKEQPSINATIRSELWNYLKEVNELKGEADFSEVWNAYDNWLYGYERTVESEEVTPELMGMYARAGTTTLKLALIMQASLKPQIEVTAEAMQRAIAFVEYVHRATTRVAERFADSRFGKQMQRVIDYLESQGGKASRSEVLKYSKLSARQLSEIISTLKESGRIEEEKAEGKKKPGRATTLYVLKED